MVCCGTSAKMCVLVDMPAQAGQPQIGNFASQDFEIVPCNICGSAAEICGDDESA